MARPKKQTVEYFPHVCVHKKTMYILEQKYGNDGYAFWFKLLEMLGVSEGHYLDLSDDAAMEFLMARTRTDEATCNEILDMLSRLEAIDKELWENHRVVWSQNFVDGLDPLYRKRATEKPTKPSLRTGNPASGEVSGEKTLQSKVEESKVNKSPLNNSTSVLPQHEVAAGLDAGNPTGYPNEFESFWSEYPRKIRKADAYAAWLQLINRNVQAADIVKAARNYALACRGKKPDHLLHPASFLAPVNQPFRVYLEARGDPGKKYAHQHPVTDLQHAIQRKTKLGLEE